MVARDSFHSAACAESLALMEEATENSAHLKRPTVEEICVGGGQHAEGKSWEGNSETADDVCPLGQQNPGEQPSSNRVH